jgi:hypothetical protein
LALVTAPSPRPRPSALLRGGRGFACLLACWVGGPARSRAGQPLLVSSNAVRRILAALPRRRVVASGWARQARCTNSGGWGGARFPSVGHRRQARNGRGSRIVEALVPHMLKPRPPFVPEAAVMALDSALLRAALLGSVLQSASAGPVSTAVIAPIEAKNIIIRVFGGLWANGAR